MREHLVVSAQNSIRFHGALTRPKSSSACCNYCIHRRHRVSAIGRSYKSTGPSDAIALEYDESSGAPFDSAMKPRQSPRAAGLYQQTA